MTSDENEGAAREFGGPLGTAIIMVLSHGLMLYLWIAWRFNDGAAPFPAGLSDVGSFLARDLGADRYTCNADVEHVRDLLGVPGSARGDGGPYPRIGDQGVADPIARRQATGLSLQWNHRLVPDVGRRHVAAL